MDFIISYTLKIWTTWTLLLSALLMEPLQYSTREILNLFFIKDETYGNASGKNSVPSIRLNKLNKFNSETPNLLKKIKNYLRSKKKLSLCTISSIY